MTTSLSSRQAKSRRFGRGSGNFCHADAPANQRASLSRRRKYRQNYLRWLWPQRRAFMVVILLALLVAAFDLSWPLAVRHLVNQLSRDLPVPQRASQLNVWGSVTLALLVVKQFIDATRAQRTAVLNAKLLTRLRKQLFKCFISMPLARLGQWKSGEVVSRLSSDLDTASGLFESGLINPGVALVRVLLTAAIVVTLSPRFVLAAMLLLPALAAVSFVWLRRVRPLHRSIRDDQSVIDGRVVEIFSGIRIVRGFQRESTEKRYYALDHHAIVRKELRAHCFELVLTIGWSLLLPGAIVFIVWYVGRGVLTGTATIGDIFALQIYAVLLIGPFIQIVHSISQMQRSFACMERVFEVLNSSGDRPDAADAVRAPRGVEEISFRGVSFEHTPGVPVIRDLELRVAGGRTIALVGPSGAGKSTLTDLVARFYDPTSGAICLNGIDLRQFRVSSYRRLLAIVQQETFLFDGSVHDNIAYGRRGASREDVIAAAILARAHEFIKALPHGYETMIGERGATLSGGQRQRISIARALIGQPQILILDEATSNLDSESEQLITAALEDLVRGRTTFVIAHRLSTIARADLIVVVDRGRVIETGAHEQLMAQRGSYFTMVNRQRAGLAAL